MENKFSFAYASLVQVGEALDVSRLPQMWWKNIDPDQANVLAVTIGIILKRNIDALVKIELVHEDDDQGITDEQTTNIGQADHFFGYPEGRDIFIGVSTLHIGNVKIVKTGMYTLNLKIELEGQCLDSIQTYFFVESLQGADNG